MCGGSPWSELKKTKLYGPTRRRCWHGVSQPPRNVSVQVVLIAIRKCKCSHCASPLLLYDVPSCSVLLNTTEIPQFAGRSLSPCHRPSTLRDRADACANNPLF